MDLIDLKAAAASLGVSKRKIEGLIASGRLQSYRLEGKGKHLVSPGDLQALLQLHAPRERLTREWIDRITREVLEKRREGNGLL